MSNVFQNTRPKNRNLRYFTRKLSEVLANEDDFGRQLGYTFVNSQLGKFPPLSNPENRQKDRNEVTLFYDGLVLTKKAISRARGSDYIVEGTRMVDEFFSKNEKVSSSSLLTELVSAFETMEGNHEHNLRVYGVLLGENVMGRSPSRGTAYATQTRDYDLILDTISELRGEGNRRSK
jgi:hypothetical protein